MEIKIVNVNGHYEAFHKANGNFICSGDTKSETQREAEICLAEGK